jgi:WD40 repeat protein
MYGDERGKLHFFSMENDKLEKLFSQRTPDRVTGLASLGSGTIASGHHRGDIVLWRVDWKEKTVTRISEFDAKGAYDIIPLPDNRLAHRNSSNSISVWDLKELTCLLTIKRRDQIHDGWITKDKSMFITATSKGEIILWDSKNFSQLECFDLHSISGDSYVYTIHEISRNILAIQYTQRLLFFNLQTRKEVCSFSFTDLSYACVAGGSFIAVERSGRISVFEQEWNFFSWLFLGKSDKDSFFFGLPVEVHYHFVCLLHENVAELC